MKNDKGEKQLEADQCSKYNNDNQITVKVVSFYNCLKTLNNISAQQYIITNIKYKAQNIDGYFMFFPHSNRHPEALFFLKSVNCKTVSVTWRIQLTGEISKLASIYCCT